MTLHAIPAIRRPDRAPARLRAAPLVELSGYMADETVFDLVRGGTEQAIARSGIEAPVYLCHSLGCFVGLDAASHVPGACVIAINMPASPWHGFRRACVIAARMTQIAAMRGFDEANHYRNSWIYFGRAGSDDIVRQRLKQIHQQSNCYTTPRRQDMALFLKTVLLERRRKGPHAPRVLLVQGASDPIAPLRDAVLLQKRSPTSVLATIKGAHVLPVTHPREVVGEIASFLSAS